MCLLRQHLTIRYFIVVPNLGKTGLQAVERRKMQNKRCFSLYRSNAFDRLKHRLRFSNLARYFNEHGNLGLLYLSARRCVLQLPEIDKKLLDVST